MRFLVGALCLTLPAQSVLACACCVEKGERFEQTEALNDLAREEFSTLSGTTVAQVFVTACDLECVQGVADPQYEYAGDLTVTDGVFRLDFPGVGALSLPLGAEYARFGVDTDPFSEGPGLGLFSEFRFQGTLTADGDFSEADGTTASLIFSGQTNWCWSGADISHWSLDVIGPEVEFRLFGQFDVPQ